MTDDRSEMQAAREAGLRQRHEQRLARAQANDESAPKWSDLFGMDPDFTGESCSVDYVRWSRGAESVDEYEHPACWSFLNSPKEGAGHGEEGA